MTKALYAQAIKSWTVNENVSLQLSGGAATLMPDFDELFGLAGIVASFLTRYSAFVNYDAKTSTKVCPATRLTDFPCHFYW